MPSKYLEPSDACQRDGGHDPKPVTAQEKASITAFAALAPMILIVLSICEPYAGTALNIPDYEVIWFAEIFVGALLCITPLSAAILKRFGPVVVLRSCVTGIALLGLAILAIDLINFEAPQWPLLAVFGLLGAFSAPLAPAAQTLAATIYPPDERGKGMAIWGAGRFGGFLVGAVIAGPIIEMSTWSAPLVACLLVAILSWPLAREPKAFPRDREHKIDWSGAAWLSLSLVTLTFALSAGTELGWLSSPEIIACVVIAPAAFVLYVLHSRRVEHPVLPLAPLRERSLAVPLTLTLLVAFTTTGQFSILLLGERIGISADLLSVRTTAGGIAQLAGVAVGGWLCRPHMYRIATALALAITAAGLFSFTLYEATSGVATITATRAVMGFGLGMSVPLLAALAYHNQRDHVMCDVSSLLVFSMMFGTELGLATLGIVLDELIRQGVGYPHTYHVTFMIEGMGVLICIPLLLLLRPHRS